MSDLLKLLRQPKEFQAALRGVLKFVRLFVVNSLLNMQRGKAAKTCLPLAVRDGLAARRPECVLSWAVEYPENGESDTILA